jgi:hypothetical protein
MSPFAEPVGNGLDSWANDVVDLDPVSYTECEEERAARLRASGQATARRPRLPSAQVPGEEFVQKRRTLVPLLARPPKEIGASQPRHQ